MFAIVETGGKQYRVEKGSVVDVERVSGDAGSVVTFEKVLMAGKDGAILALGTPFIKGAEVKARIVEQVKAPKLHVFKKRRRKHSQRLQGHRQMLTRLEITGISA